MTDTPARRLRRLRREHLLASSTETSAQSHPAAESFAWIQEVATANAEQALRVVLETNVETWFDDPATVATIWVEFVRRQQTKPFSLTAQQVAVVSSIYRQLGDHVSLRALLLRFLVSTGQPRNLQSFATLMVEDPVRQLSHLVEIFGDLLRAGEAAFSAVFPQLLDALYHPELASFVLDFANFGVRNGLAEEHPARSRADELIQLLSGLADRLGKLQESKPSTREETAKVGRQVTESIALGVSLCDALALIGDVQAVGSLYKVLEVEHRRLRVEAAAALARLGEEAGRDLLPSLAAEPAERLRVLAYAEELGLLDQVQPQYASSLARVEAQFVMHLAEPTRFGLAPHYIELVDEREIPWPGFDEPQRCYLFQFVYAFPSGEYINIGIAGPVVFSFHADLSTLSYEDIYALFAGWHVQHPDIFAIEPHRAVGQDQLELSRLHGNLVEEGYEDLTPALVGSFLGRRMLIASAARGGETGWAMVSDDSYGWLPQVGERPLGAMEAFYLFLGRALLASFRTE